MRKTYDQYCPIAHALDLVGDRWALLVVRELIHGPKRYTDLAEHLPGIGTNILAARLRDLEQGGVVTKRTLPPPAASRVYELTEYGLALKPTLRELARWGALSLGPPQDEDELFPGWLVNALDVMFSGRAPAGRFQFHVGEETAWIIDGDVQEGTIEDPDVVIEAEPSGIFHLLINHKLDHVSIRGNRKLVKQLVATAPHPDDAVVAA